MNRKYHREITEVEIRAYAADGVICVRDVIDSEWRGRLADAIERDIKVPDRFITDTSHGPVDSTEHRASGS